jgi:hypothetical protein
LRSIGTISRFWELTHPQLEQAAWPLTTGLPQLLQ